MGARLGDRVGPDVSVIGGSAIEAVGCSVMGIQYAVVGVIIPSAAAAVAATVGTQGCGPQPRGRPGLQYPRAADAGAVPEKRRAAHAAQSTRW